jgi:putative ABC transport system substrate-binding protein
MPVIGFLEPRSPDALADRLRGFRQGLKDSGFAEGQNAAIEYRWAENQMDRLPELAADLVRRQVAVIVTPGGLESALQGCLSARGQLPNWRDPVVRGAAPRAVPSR